jgi:hypothetical protein
MLHCGNAPESVANSDRRSRAIAFGETVAFFSSVIPAEAGIQRPKTRHSPLDSRLRGNDGNREVENPNAIALTARGAICLIAEQA